MSMVKKGFLWLLGLAICVSAIPARQISAANQTGDEALQPMMEYIMNATVDFNIPGSTANTYVYASGNPAEVTKCEIVVELQKKNLLSWEHVETWCVVRDGYRTSLSKTKAVISGKTYRVVATVTMWSGTDTETKTITSNAVQAP